MRGGGGGGEEREKEIVMDGYMLMNKKTKQKNNNNKNKNKNKDLSRLREVSFGMCVNTRYLNIWHVCKYKELKHLACV